MTLLSLKCINVDTHADLTDLFTEPDTRIRQGPPRRDVRAEYRPLQPGSSPSRQ